MNYKLLLGLILLSVIVFPYLPAATQASEQTPTTLVWGATTQQDVGILMIAQGTYDVFLFSNILPWYDTLDPTVRANLTLIKTTTGYYDLVFNIAENVLDSSGGTTDTLWYGPITGTVIPGLIYWFPAGTVNEYNISGYVYLDNISNANTWDRLHFNPVALRKVRMAFNYLVDRDLLVRSILGGSGEPAFGAIMSFHPFYPQIEDIYFTEYGFTATGDTAKAQQLFMEAIQEANSTLVTYGMYVYYKSDSNSPYGAWLYFHKADGSEEPVVLNFLIRQEDERREMGLQIADWIERYFGVQVNRLIRDRSACSSAVYYTNPVMTHPQADNKVWSIYTEGWITTAELLPTDARYDIPWFYLSLSGYGPNFYGPPKTWWSWYNATMYNAVWNTKDGLYMGIYTAENVDDLYANITKWFKQGLIWSIRVFLTLNYEYFAVNKNSIVGLTPGKVTGLYNFWALRGMLATKDTIKLLEFSASGGLFMSPWNPVSGFSDIYSELMHRVVADFDMVAAPDTAIPKGVRVKSWTVERGVTLPSTAYIYDPVNNNWTFISNANGTFIDWLYGDYGGYNTTAIKNQDWTDVGFYSPHPLVKVTVNYDMNGGWHDGSNISMADVIYAWGWNFEWVFNDEIATGEADPYYDSQVETNVAPSLSQIFGIEVVNATALTIYIDYDDVYDELVVDTAVGWPDVPWHLMYAMEKMIVAGATAPDGKPYAWWDTETTTAHDLLDSDVATAVANELNDLKNAKAAPEYITTWPDQALVNADDNQTRYDNAINFINTYHHAYISSGPYYVESYNPVTFTLTMKYWTPYDNVYPRGYWAHVFTVIYSQPVGTPKAPSTLWLAFGQELRIYINFKVAQISPTYQTLSIDPSKARVTASIFYQNGTKLADIPDQYIHVYGNGTVLIKLPAAYLNTVIVHGHTPYYIVYNIDYEGSSSTVTGYVEVDIISEATPPPTPEPTLLPLLLLAALLVVLLIIRRK